MKKMKMIVVVCLVFFTSMHSAINSQTIFESKYIKQSMLRATDWQLKHPRYDLWDWTNGALYTGISAAYKATKDEFYLNAILEMGEKNQWKPGERVMHADDHAIAQAYIDVYRIKKDPKMIETFRKMMDQFLITPYQPNGIETITWWWCDALFMAPPALTKLSAATGDMRYLQKSDSLYHECYNLLFDKNEHLFARDLNYVIKNTATDRREKNGQKVFWSRGNGWVLGGLAIMLSDMPKSYKGRSFYVSLFKEMSARVASLQQADGLWRASLLDPDSYPGAEASGSGFYTFALTWGINNGLLSLDSYLPVVKKGWSGLNSLIQPQGYVGWCQPIGWDPRKNFCAENCEVYGTGAYLLAGSEVLKLKIKK